MKVFGSALALIVVIALGAWLAFRFQPWAPEPRETDIADLTVVGEASARSLIGVQPWLEETDYRSAEALGDRLGDYLERAAAESLIAEDTVVVFPEHVGTWLVAADGPRAVYAAETVTGAMTALIAARPLAFTSNWIGSGEEDRAAAGVFRMNAARMARDYQAVFSALAQEYGVTIVAGSVVLPEPYVEDGVLRVNRNGDLYNTAAVFDPDGAIRPDLVRKAYPIPSERPFTASASAADMPVFDTPLGRLGVLVCADSWHPDVYAALEDGGAEVLAVPAFLQGDDVWDEPWGGYTTPWPGDAPRSDAGRLTEGEAWTTHALAGRIADTSAAAGLTTFLRGGLWDLGSDGRAIVSANGETRLGGDVEGGAITALFLPDET
ncbi:carbon-nitrogen hydrolase family protein [Marinicauda salina]|nr:carbon-nitrogen hydrolase family protein [Marinicauda salina]